MKSRIWFLPILVPALTLAQQTQRFLPGRISPPAANANSQFRPPFSTQPPTVFRRVNLNNQGQMAVRNRQPPTTSVARPSAIQVKPAAIPSSAVKAQQFPQRRIPSPAAAQGNRPATMTRQPPTTITNPPQRLPSSQSTVAANPVPLARPQTTKLLPPPATAPIRRPISATAPFVSNSINVPSSTGLRVAQKPPAPLGASPPGIQPPSNSVVEQLNSASDFMLVAQRLQLRRFARHRNRRHASFIERQLTQNA